MRVFAAMALGLSVVAVTATLATPALAVPGKGNGDPWNPNAQKGKVDDQYLITLADGVIVDDFLREKDHGNDNGKGHALKGIFRRSGNGYAIKFKKSKVAEELADLRGDPRVASVEQDQYLELHGSRTAATWGLDRIDQATRPLDGIFNVDQTGRGVTVYVVDTGIMASHVDFLGRVRSGYSSGGGTGDCNGHGTHIAGTIGGAVMGAAPSVSLVANRVTDCEGQGTLTDALEAIDWIIEDHQPGVRAVMNLSLGTPRSTTFDTAVANAVFDGLVVVAAAGNSGSDACSESPGSAPNALTVSAVDIDDRRSDFANTGPCVDLFAPGDAILSDGISSSAATMMSSGTSMAAPHVAAAAALLLEREPTLTPAGVVDRLLALSTKNVVGNPGPASPNRLLRLIAGTSTASTGVTSGASASGGGSASSAAAKPKVKRLARPRILKLHHDGDYLTIWFSGPPRVVFQLYANGKLMAQTRKRRLTLMHGPAKRDAFRIRAVNATGRSPFSQTLVWHDYDHWVRARG